MPVRQKALEFATGWHSHQQALLLSAVHSRDVLVLQQPRANETERQHDGRCGRRVRF
jgi:hypothetical protein